MKFKTHNEDLKINAIGTCLQSEIVAKFSTLKKIFGEPLDGDGEKVDAEWVIEFEDGTVATIYNYKDGKIYNGRSGIATTKLTDWHIGGIDSKSVENVTKLLGEKI
jgi:hypothetical protein